MPVKRILFNIAYGYELIRFYHQTDKYLVFLGIQILEVTSFHKSLEKSIIKRINNITT
ncbi:MAG TPA: hypothetical protein VN704_04060 [Verrucomicrobiae bacterium]|nr:hypothetical protein [Verrucomicrobiae bacterium]